MSQLSKKIKSDFPIFEGSDLVYLDNAATTQKPQSVLDSVNSSYIESNANVHRALYSLGAKATEKYEGARKKISAFIGANSSKEIIFTSGATESDNLAIKGAAHFYKEKGNHLITLTTEHKAVLDTMRHLETEGFEVTYMNPKDNGLVDIDELKSLIKPTTTVISIMHVNNEIGVIQDLETIGKICRDNKIVFHVDAAQSTGKVDIDLQKICVDLMSFSAHKTYGPKGIGALYVRRKPRVRLEALIHGGGHERGMRSGTLATHQIVGMGEAFRLASKEMKEDHNKIVKFHEKFLDKVKEIDHVYINGDLDNKVPNILNVSFNFVEGESLIMGLKDIAVSSGSACTSASLEPSYVLRALGRKDELAHSSIRFSFGRFTSDDDVNNTLDILGNVVHRLRELSPLWEMHLDGIDLDTVEWNAH